MQSRSAFTLVELIATIAIVAILVAVMVPTVGNFVSQSRQTADRQTLAVLNDAINRYKMQGGDVSVLTQGTPLTSLINILSTPITWNGVTHQFWRGNNNLSNVESMASTGSGKDYRITQLNSYEGEAGGITAPLVPPPSYGGILQSFSTSSTTHDTYTTTLTGAVEAGDRLVLAYAVPGSTNNMIASITDSKGNTWAVDHNYTSNSRYYALASAAITSRLESGDSVTINYTSSTYRNDCGEFHIIHNSTQRGDIYPKGGYGTSISSSGTVNNAPATLFALLNVGGSNTANANWSFSPFFSGSLGAYCAFLDVASSGNQTLSATLDSAFSYGSTWIVYH